MPPRISAQLLLDTRQVRQLRQQALSSRAPADEISHATMVVHSWDGLRTCPIAQELGRHSRIVRDRLQAFNAPARSARDETLNPTDGRGSPTSNAGRSSHSPNCPREESQPLS